MKEIIEKRIEQLRQDEKNILNEIQITDKRVADLKASLISVRGGIYELFELLKPVKEVEEITEEE